MRGMSANALPSLFVSHGSPMLAVDPGHTGPALAQWGAALRQAHPGLRGVVMMSPHWMSRGLRVMTHPQPATWHDFGGFPEALYQLQYPAPGHPGLADAVMQRLTAAGLAASADAERPFDHGAWVPMRYLFPAADVPLVQLSLPASARPADVYAVGRALAGLREEGVLLVGSGSMTHNLQAFFAGRPPQQAPAAAYVQAFARWVEDALQAGDLDALLDYRNRAPDAARAHPTDEHFLPLYLALGAAGWGQPGGPKPHYITREVMYSHLAMDAIGLH